MKVSKNIIPLRILFAYFTNSNNISGIDLYKEA